MLAKCQQPFFFERAVTSPELVTGARVLSIDITPRPAGSFICKARPPGELAAIDQLLNDADRAQQSGDQAQADRERADAQQRLRALSTSHKTGSGMPELPVRLAAYADTSAGLHPPPEVAFDWWMAAEEERAGNHDQANQWGQTATSAIDDWAQSVLNDPNATIEDVLAAGADVARTSGADTTAFLARATRMAKDQADKAISALPCPPTHDGIVNMMDSVVLAAKLGVDEQTNQAYSTAFRSAEEASIRAAAQDLPAGPSDQRAALAVEAGKVGLDDLANQVNAAGAGGPQPDPPKCGGFELKGSIPITFFGGGASVTRPMIVIEAHTCGTLTGSHWTGSAALPFPGLPTESYLLAFDVPKGGGEVPMMPDTPDGDHLAVQITEGSQTATLTYRGLFLNGEVATDTEPGAISSAPEGTCPK